MNKNFLFKVKNLTKYFVCKTNIKFITCIVYNYHIPIFVSQQNTDTKVQPFLHQDYVTLISQLKDT